MPTNRNTIIKKSWLEKAPASKIKINEFRGSKCETLADKKYSTMKEKILSIIYKKLSDGFQTNFLRPGEFESLYSKHYPLLLEQLASFTRNYNKLKHSENKDESSEVIKVYKEDFIIKSFNDEERNYYSQKRYTIDNLKELQEAKQDLYNNYAKKYDYHFQNEIDNLERQFVIPLMTYVETKANEIASSLDSKDNLSVEVLFWNYFLSSFTEWGNRIRKEDLINSPESVLETFKTYYLSTDFLQLLSITDKQISDIEFSGLESCIINVGERKYSTERSGWTTNNFQVLNNDKKYEFSTSTKDESKIEGKFINIFILQLNKRHLLKISITLNETEQTPYIIYKDFEKVSLKNECEILIAKHHGNETIIFDSKKEALDFQAKVLEIKEGRSNNNRRN